MSSCNGLGIDNAPTIKTKVSTFNFDTSTKEGREGWYALKDKLSGTHKLFDCIETSKLGNPRWWVECFELELETSYVFADQWNTVCGKRVFDWYSPIVPNRHIKRGYYLDITKDMVRVRESTLKCGYCGHLYRGQALPGITTGEKHFCNKCLDSPYLKEEELKLLRLENCLVSFPEREELSEAEKDSLIPEYVRQQTVAVGSRTVAKRAKQREDIENKYKRETKEAQTEHDGMMWLWDNHIPLDNVIYYSHTNKFSFGWRSPLSDSVYDKILDVISEFPYEYEIKGRTKTE